MAASQPRSIAAHARARADEDSLGSRLTVDAEHGVSGPIGRRRAGGPDLKAGALQGARGAGSFGRKPSQVGFEERYGERARRMGVDMRQGRDEGAASRPGMR
jgi:hypothetical protein